MTIFEQYLPFVLIAVIVLCLYLLLQTRYKKQVSQMLLYLVAQAEKEFGSKTGQIKFAAVCAWLYERLPATAKLVLSPIIIERMIEEAVLHLKEYLDNNAQARMVITDDKDNNTVSA